MAATKETIQQAVFAEAIRQGVDPRIALAIAEQESGFNQAAVSPAGAIGTMQLMPATAKDLGVDPYDLKQNIQGGVTYYRQMLDRYQTPALALAAYNAGPGAVDRHKRVPPYKETQGYVGKILGKIGSAFSPEAAEAEPVLSLEEAPLPPTPKKVEGEPTDGQEKVLSLEEIPLPPTPEQQRGEVEVLSSGPPGTAGVMPSVPGTPTMDAPSQGAPGPLEALGQFLQGKQRLSSEQPSSALEQRLTAGKGANVGEILGQAAAGLIPGGGIISQGVRVAAGGIAGAMGGDALQQLMQTGTVDPVKVAIEGGISAIPEVAETAVRGIGRSFVRRLPGAMIIRFDEAAKKAREMVGEVFPSLNRQQVGQYYDEISASGLLVAPRSLKDETRRLSGMKYKELLSEVSLLDSRYKTGGRYAALVADLRRGRALSRGWDIGDLEKLRSAVRIRANEIGTFEGRQLLKDFQHAVDDAILTDPIVGNIPAGQTRELIKTARREWAVLRANEELRDLVEAKIRSTPDVKKASFQLRLLVDELRRNRSEASKAVNRALDLNPGARDRFNQYIASISKLYDTLQLPMTDVSGPRRNYIIAAIGQMFSNVLLSPTGQRLFHNAVIQGRGKLSINALALIANAVNRDAVAKSEQMQRDIDERAAGVIAEGIEAAREQAGLSMPLAVESLGAR